MSLPHFGLGDRIGVTLDGELFYVESGEPADQPRTDLPHADHLVFTERNDGGNFLPECLS